MPQPTTRPPSSTRDGPGALRVEALGADAAWLLDAIAAHRAALDRKEGILKDEHKTSITRICERGRRAVVKHYRYMGPRFLLKGIFRMHPGRRSLAASRAMAERGIPTPRALGLVERTVVGLPVESWFVTEDLEGATEMDRYILRNFEPPCDRGERKRFVLAFAAQLEALMRSGIHHRDLKTCNILVVERDGGWRFAFIDLDDVLVLPPGRRMGKEEWILALAQLNPSTPKIVPWTDRMRFLGRLEDLEAMLDRSLMARVQEISRRRRRAYFSDEGEVEIDFV